MRDIIEIGDPYTTTPSGRVYFDEAEALGQMLLADSVLFVWKNDQGQVSIGVNCNDLFYWACSDSEPVTFDEIEEVWKAYNAGGAEVSKWACKKRGQRPQEPVIRRWKELGYWDDEMEALP